MKYVDFEKIGWKHPYSKEASITDLIYTLYRRIGIENLMHSENSDKISDLIPVSQNYVLILIDGMGYNLLKKTLPDSFLAKNIKLCMNTVFPSSTGTVLTTLSTALFPEKHSINGWFSYDKSNDESFVTLPFMNRFDTSIPLKTPFEKVFFCEPMFSNIPIQTNSISNQSILNSSFSRWALGCRNSYGYTDFNNCFEILGKLIEQNDNSFNYVYLGEYDGKCHKYGSNSSEAKTLLEEFNSLIEKFSNAYSKKCTTIVIADHGQVTIDPANYNVILPDDTLCNYFYAPPGGDSRASCFYVKNDCENEFIKEFNARFGDQSVLMSIEEVDKIGLLGLHGMDNITKERFGNHIAIWKENFAFKYSQEAIANIELDIGNHGGLTKDEMEVPLIIF